MVVVVVVVAGGAQFSLFLAGALGVRFGWRAEQARMIAFHSPLICFVVWRQGGSGTTTTKMKFGSPSSFSPRRKGRGGRQTENTQ